MYYTNVLDLIGNTPLISLDQTTGMQIYAKTVLADRAERYFSTSLI